MKTKFTSNDLEKPVAFYTVTPYRRFEKGLVLAIDEFSSEYAIVITNDGQTIPIHVSQLADV